MDVIIAARLSKSGNAETSIASQDEDAREWAEKQGHNVIDTVADHASGTKAMWDRPNLKPWVTELELMDKYQAIVAAKQDRLSRADWRDEGDLRRWAEDNGKILFIVDRDLRWPPCDGARHDDDVEAWNRGAEDAHREWNSTSKRYKRMHKTLRDNNLLIGRPPYGYRPVAVEGSEHKTLGAYEPEARVVREIVTRYIGGDSIAVLCDDLNARGVPSPRYRGEPGKHWHPKTLAKLLRNPALAGRRMDSSGKTVLTYPGIIMWTQHEELVLRLDSRANRKGISPANSYMLTGVLFDEQAHPMYAIASRGSMQVPVYMYYRCRQGCGGGGIPVGKADALATDAVIGRYGDLSHYVQRTVPGKNYFETMARLRQDRAELDDLADDYDERHAALTAEIRQLDKLPAGPNRTEWVKSGKSVREHWAGLDDAGRRDWLKDGGWKFIAARESVGWSLRMDAVGEYHGNDIASVPLRRKPEDRMADITGQYRSVQE